MWGWLRGGKVGGVGVRILRFMQHAMQLFKFGARFFPFARVEKCLRAQLLQLDSGIWIFLAEGFGEGRKRGGRSLGFIRQRVLVETDLIILAAPPGLATSPVGLRTLERQRRV